MNRLDVRRKEVMDRGEKVLTCLLPLGDPDLDTSVKLIDLYLKAGVDVVELGMPSENPYLDSEQIAASNRRSFSAHPDYSEYLQMWKVIRAEYPDEPFEVMAYKDTVETIGMKQFADALAEADFDGHLLADAVVFKPELGESMDELLKPSNIYRIRFMPHPFREDLLPDISENGQGFTILQAIADEAGKREVVAEENRALIERIRSGGTRAAILIAYGINNGDRAREAVALGPDGILVGTSMVNRIADLDFPGLEAIISELKAATFA
jgi:tryptophan synthase alpha chain